MFLQIYTKTAGICNFNSRTRTHKPLIVSGGAVRLLGRGRGHDAMRPCVGRGRRWRRALPPPPHRDGREAVDVLVDGDVGEAGALQLRVRAGLELQWVRERGRLLEFIMLRVRISFIHDISLIRLSR